MIDINTLRIWALEAGFCEAALCNPSSFTLQEKTVADSEPLKERRQLVFDPVKDDMRTKSLAVLLWPYAPAPLSSQGEVFVDSYYYASNAAYHAAKELENRLIAAGHFARSNVNYPAKAAAVRAGLGIIGMNDLFITKTHGSRVVIILMATDIEAGFADNSEEAAIHTCMQCGKCIKACPTGALTSDGMTAPKRCLRNYMMEGVLIPEELRRKMDQKLIGCDVCQRVCPMQPVTEYSVTERGFLLSDFVTDDPLLFSQSVSRLAYYIGKNAARPQRVRAQAAILAGNSLKEEYLPVLRKWADMPFKAVSVHAQWAVEKIGQHKKESADLDHQNEKR